MKLGKFGEALIKDYEKKVLKAYQDEGGIWTIGWGHTNNVRPGQVIDSVKAELFFQADLKPTEQAVNAVVRTSKVPVTQGMYDAMVSFAFNVGDQGFAHSTVVHMLQQGNKKGAADAFLMWNKVKGKTSKGLVNRRNAERKMFLGEK